MSAPATQLREVSAEGALDLASKGYRILDVREPGEWNAGHIPDATLLPLADLPSRAAQVVPDKNAPLLVHCAVGARSLRAAAWLLQNGYRDVVSMRAPLRDWRQLGGAWEAPQELLTPAQQLRYSRQVLIPEIGQAGQRKLLDSRVLLIGAGGLGSPVALYLAASGIGTLGLVDDDVVDESNLQRQIIHGQSTLGQPKRESAKARLLDINPHIQVDTYGEPLTSANALDILRDYDIVVDGTDNFQTRYLVNDACVLLGKPNVYGSIFRFEGQASVFYAKEGPCYRCLYPEPPPPGLVTS